LLFNIKWFFISLSTIVILLTISSQGFPTSLVNVPLDHWSYKFIERLQAKGILGEFLHESKPYSRGKVSEMIIHTLQLLEEGKIHLTDVDIDLLEEMKKEFAQELAEQGQLGIQGHKHTIDWSSGEKAIIFRLGFAQDGSFSKSDTILTSTLNTTFYGDISKNVSFYNYSKASYEIGGERPVWAGLDPRYTRYPWSGLSDSYIVFGGPWGDIQVGKDTVIWGPGYHGVIGLAGVDSTFSLIRFRTHVWKLNFTSLSGFLRDDLTKEYYSDVPKKYLSAHRFEITPYPGICIAWQEAYVYAEELHIELLNPIMPYQMAEDYLGDIGNNTMEGDIVITLIPNTKLYSALFLDDFYTDKSPFKYPGFGWAILNGIMVADPFGINNTDVILEYARVEPWTYTHKGTRQNPPIPTAYKHFNEPLGHWIGPNADDLFTQIGYQINKSLRGNVSYNRIRNGEIGGNMYDTAIGYKEKKFLEGIVEVQNIFDTGLKYIVFDKFEISTNYKHIRTKNKQNEETKLPRNNKRWQSWKSGWNTVVNEFDIKLSFKY